ncbi:MAG: hypothetical protein HC771_23620 [Synechococcales cyanobacterium CRU_2_2]|nr:hypothetical protein [Synechococcales cyanobacterium CRU_2_2]
MARHWAIAIGVNNYSAFQSLSFAQNDAEAFCRELLSSGRVTPANCLLLTTASALHLGQSTFPLQTTLLQWFQWLVDQALQADDELWVFFSGYGIHADGVDYLMPVDGDPKQPASTGIAMRSLFQLLQEAASDRILLLLDMNHNEASLTIPVGLQTAALAQEYGIATVQSCEPQKGQFSRKAAGLQHGFFTVALLDALRSGTLQSLADLNLSLKQRMEELSDHYWRPEQTPLLVGTYSFRPAPVLAQGSSGNSGSGNNGFGNNDSGNNGSSHNSVSQGTANLDGLFSGASGSTVVTPLDFNYVPMNLAADFGEAFVETWGDRPGNPLDESLNDGSPLGESLSYESLSHESLSHESLSDDPIEDSGEDPYAVVWQQAEITDGNLGPGANSIPGSGGPLPDTNPERSGQDFNTVTEVYLDYGDGKAGASSWHWADLVVAPEQPGAGGTGLYPEPSPLTLPPSGAGAWGGGDPLPESYGPESSSLDFPADGFPGAGFSGAGLLEDGFPGVNGGSAIAGSSAQTANQTAPQNDAQNAIQTIDVPSFPNGGGGTAWTPVSPTPVSPILVDDDDGGLPIIELDPLEPEEDTAQAEGDRPSASGSLASRLPSWFNLKLLGAAGLILLATFGLLGLLGQDREPDRPELSPGERSGGNSQDSQSQDSQSQDRGTEDSGGQNSATQNSATQNSGAQNSDAQNSAEKPAGDKPAGDKPAGAAAQTFTTGTQPDTGGAIAPSPAQQTQQAQQAQPNTVPQSPKDANSANTNSANTNSANTNSANSPTTASNGKQILEAARNSLRPDQASSYNQAMTLARRIPSSDPEYKAARAQMDEWSQSILKLGQTRADKGDYLGAIAAARLVPSDLLGSITAQESIAQWQTPAQLQHAKALVRPGSASSYNQRSPLPEAFPQEYRARLRPSNFSKAGAEKFLILPRHGHSRGSGPSRLQQRSLSPPIWRPSLRLKGRSPSGKTA